MKAGKRALPKLRYVHAKMPELDMTKNLAVILGIYR